MSLRVTSAAFAGDVAERARAAVRLPCDRFAVPRFLAFPVGRELRIDPLRYYGRNPSFPVASIDGRDVMLTASCDLS